MRRKITKIRIAVIVLVVLYVLAIIQMDLSLYETLWHLGRMALLFIPGYAVAKYGG